MIPKERKLAPDEIKEILSFCKIFGLECGELDVLRDNVDRRIYIVDANITCGGPTPGKELTSKEYWRFITEYASSFQSAFMQNKL